MGGVRAPGPCGQLGEEVVDCDLLTCGWKLWVRSAGGWWPVAEQAPTMQQPAFALSLALASCALAQGNLDFLSRQIGSQSIKTYHLKKAGHMLIKVFFSAQLLVSLWNAGPWEPSNIDQGSDLRTDNMRLWKFFITEVTVRRWKTFYKLLLSHDSSATYSGSWGWCPSYL